MHLLPEDPAVSGVTVTRQGPTQRKASCGDAVVTFDKHYFWIACDGRIDQISDVIACLAAIRAEVCAPAP